MVDLYLKNARVVTEATEFHGGVLVDGEKIAQVIEGVPEVSAAQVVDLGGKVLMPGVVDDHVHFNEPGRTHWEGYRTGSMGAAAGGATTIFEMPLNATPPTEQVYLSGTLSPNCWVDISATPRRRSTLSSVTRAS